MILGLALLFSYQNISEKLDWQFLSAIIIPHLDRNGGFNNLCMKRWQCDSNQQKEEKLLWRTSKQVQA